MGYITTLQTITYRESVWWVNALPSGIYTHQMKRILSQIEAMFSYHNKLLIVRFDLHQYIETANSNHVTLFFKQLVAFLKRQYKIKRVGYAWARESEKVRNQHYHCILILDGNHVQRPHHVFTQAKMYWGFCYEGRLCWPAERCYYLVRRGDREELQKAIYHISYLAKGRGKGKKPVQAKNYGTSRIRINPKAS